jgi:hypothetical protein
LDAATIEASDCQIVNDAKQFGELKWFGQCKDGFASGEGVARWYLNGILSWEQTYAKERGIIREHGEPKLVEEVINKSIAIKIKRCDLALGIRRVTVDAPSSLALEGTLMTRYVLNAGRVFAWKECPFRKYDNVGVEVVVEGKTIITALSRDPFGGLGLQANWEELKNELDSQKEKKFSESYSIELTRRSRE